MAGNTAKGIQIGAELRTARESAGMTLREAADKIGVQPSTISRWENGERSPKPRDVARYLTEMGAPADQIADLLELSQDPDGSPWVAVGVPSQNRQLAALLEVERQAIGITTVSPLLIPGLLQTNDYARAMMIDAEVPEDQIDARVVVRLGRKDALARKNPAKLMAFVGESVLYQNIGGPVVMADQLRSLLDTAELSNVTLQILPLHAGWHPGLEGQFVVVEFPDRPPMAHIESRRSALFFHERPDVEAYLKAVQMVQKAALSPVSSLRLIADRIREMEGTVTEPHEPAKWRKSSRSVNEGSDSCVEVACNLRETFVRDTKARSAGYLARTPKPWEAFTRSTVITADI